MTDRPTMTYSLYERLPHVSTSCGRQTFGHSFHFTCAELRFTYTATDRHAAEQGIREEIVAHGGQPKFDGVHVIDDGTERKRVVTP